MIASTGSLSAEQRRQIAERVSRYTGIKPEVVLDNNLVMSTQFFWKELLRDQGKTIGRLDSRYTGISRADAGQNPDFDPALTSWNHSFAPGINYYLRDVLGYKTNLQYWLFGPVHPWNRDNDNTGVQLANAMRQNPYLHLLVQSGYYDGGTDYFGAKYNMWQMDPSGTLQKRMRFEGYRSGHMMYLRAEDLATSNEHVRDFIRKSIPAAGTRGARRIVRSRSVRKVRRSRLFTPMTSAPRAMARVISSALFTSTRFGSSTVKPISLTIVRRAE